MKDERLMEAFEAWDELSATPEMRMAYTSRLKTILDIESKMRYAMTKGKAEGIIEANKNIIFNGYRNGLDVTTLSMLTGYSEKDVQEMIQSFQREYNKND